MLCIVMQYLDGGDLHRVVDGARQLGRQLDEVDIWRWFLQVASALQYLHKERVLHRDVKPANIFLTSAGRHAVLGDLGIAKILPSVEARALTQIGTPAYLAPEVWQGRRYGYAADIYSLGCTVYELAELRMPFTAENRGLLAAQVCRKNSKPIEARLGYSPELTRIVQLMLSKDPRP
ncbi:unnamed protein product [Prorocentrum cordatum]|uniref:non-specific serine/threonine protein kinase n=1 Tax=Prorocentrum cordatum TaxID=2364126 RepID=A0ABN9QUN9_9DINO|nr:unnamed protein product [Polarella glacialis]